MHELSIVIVTGIGAKKWKFQQLCKGLKIKQLFYIWTINKTYNKFLAHELKIRFNF
jgi:hypothetical protein